MSINTISDLVLIAAKSRNVVIEILPSEEGGKVRRRVAEKFAKGKTHWLWEHLDSNVTVVTQNQHAWRWVSDYIQNHHALMFFNSEDEKIVFRFHNGFDIVTILGETSHFEFYLTNDQTDYLICYNHHNFLSATGSAKEWLLKRIST